MAVAKAGSYVGPLDKLGHPAHCHRELRQVPVLSDRRIN